MQLPSRRVGGSYGGILVMTLVFVVMFTVIFAALASLVYRTYHESVLQAQDETAFQIAESGLNYGRWRLAHDSDNLAQETKQVDDQFAGILGEYTLSFSQPLPGSPLVLITSVGRTVNQPGREVTLKARYGRPSLASYSAIFNSDYWVGDGEVIRGAIHANGGIRMDGSSDSTIASARETYTCQSIHGCTNETKPGVWGTGTNQQLWDFPVPPVDYNAIALDLLSMKDVAVEADTYFDPSNKYGYQLVFNSDNTYSVAVVKKLRNPILSMAADTGWQPLSHDIESTQHVRTAPVPSGGVLFFEDDVWVSGDIRDRVTVASGVFPDTPGTNSDIIINGSISYGGIHDGSRSLGAIAQRHVLIPYYAAPDNLRLDGAFIAQKGSFGRRHYNSGEHVFKDSLEIFGMVASNQLTLDATWVSSGSIISGYETVTRQYDSNLMYASPPYFPMSEEYEFISWEEEQ